MLCEHGFCLGLQEPFEGFKVGLASMAIRTTVKIAAIIFRPILEVSDLSVVFDQAHDEYRSSSLNLC